VPMLWARFIPLCRLDASTLLRVAQAFMFAMELGLVLPTVQTEFTIELYPLPKKPT
jgi:hypothetical protein